jgi:hypothetical protein
MNPRVAVAVAGLAGLALAGPTSTIPGVALGVFGLVTLFGAVRYPGTTAPAMFIAVLALIWVAGDSAAATVRLPALALAVALVHSAAALAAVVPVGSRVPAALLLRWAGWTLLATVGGVAAVGATALLPESAPVPVTVAALAALGTAVVVGSVVAGRRAPRTGR